MMQIPNYTIKEEVSSDSIETTYIAESTQLNNQLVTLRVIHADVAKNDNFHHHFLAVGKRIVKLDHPYLVKVHEIAISNDINNNDTICYIAIEHLGQEQESLRHKIKYKKLPITSTLAIIKRIGTALSYLHHQGFVHCNINPDTILLDSDDKAQLADSGFIELLENASNNLDLQGTLHYMSPEQSTMTKLDHRSDIYSLGLVLYEMLTAKKAFVAETTAQAIYQHTMVCPADLPTKYSYLQPVLDKALAKSPRDRYATVQEMLHALETAIDVEYFQPFEAQKPKSPWLQRGIIGGILAVLALTIWVFSNRIAPNGFGNDNQVAINQLSLPTPDPDQKNTENITNDIAPVTLLTKRETTATIPSPSKNETNVSPSNNEVNDDREREQIDKANGDKNNDNSDNEINQPITPKPAPIEHTVPTSKVSINVFSAKDKKPLTSRMMITSKPNNEVIVDGKNLQQKAFELEAGEYEVRIEREGYVAQSQLLTITDAPHDDIVFHLKNTVLLGQLKLEAISKKSAKPLQATYEVRGIDSDYYKKRKKRTSARFKLPSGRYKFSVIYKGKTIKKQIRIKKDEVLNEQVIFTLPPVVTTEVKDKKEKNKEQNNIAKEQESKKKTSSQEAEKNITKKLNDKQATSSNVANDEKAEHDKKTKKVVLGSIYIAAKLGNKQGENLQANFYLYQNKKIIKKTAGKDGVQFQVPPGEYVIKVVYQGISSQARAMLKKGEVIEQTFVYENIPLPANRT